MTSDVPKPGQPVRGSKTGKPIMALFDLLGRSWALGILWQLSEGALTFRALQDRCEQLSPSVLNRRLKELSASGLVCRGDEGYELTAMGQDLFSLLQPFGGWSEQWAEALGAPDGGD
ncbi:helix-turn-helix transcriptional regulator [Shimia sp. R11_0]|uniref:HxlR-like helix-turn-helix n=1 Tax=Shimia marina TaxID=321267 RepID=A0A0N7LS31_9RHOB|nr:MULTISPECIES: helix-turn-helix domain-containing protein [Shimia]MBO9478955.1 helix-turn-helix transcriptional regulator [Shimia sp. R11_0]CUH52484.1 HxlR-like helix-turn-helix [Shimia marina]SFE13016.1 transcriptional regulator, HxlR family [Shimia marina]